MADEQNTSEILININGNATGLEDALKQIQNELKKTGSSSVPAEGVKSLKSQIREATQAAVALQQAGKANTEEYRRQVQVLAELRDQQEELNHVVEAFNPDNKFAGLIGIAKGAATAIQGFTGAMAFMGESGKDAAETLAKLQGIMAFTDALGSIGDIKDSFKGFTDTIKSSIATFKGADGAAKGFGLALKGLGIGLLITALTYLITNFDEIKEQFKDILPAGVDLGKTFDKLKQIFFGVGNAVLQFIIAPIKAVIDIIKGDFKKAMEDLKKGADAVGNFQKGADKERKDQVDKANKDRAKQMIEESEMRMKLLKQGSKEYLAEEDKQANLRIYIAENEAEKKKAINELFALDAQRKFKAQDEAEKLAKAAADKADAKAKAAAEKAAAERKALLEEVAKNEAAAIAVLENLNDTARDKELAALQANYEKQKALADKAGKDSIKITEAFAEQQRQVNEKYDKAITDALEARENRNATVLFTKQKEINKYYDDLLKTASDKQRELIEKQRDSELIAAGKLNSLASFANDTANVLTTTTASNAPNEKDEPQQAYDKLAAIRAAELEAEKAAHDLRLAELQGNNEELEKENAMHAAKMITIEQQRVEAEKQLADGLAKAKVDALGVAANAASTFASIAGDQTLAGKALAVSAATISTYLAATQAYASASAIPIYGQIAGPLAAAAAVAAGLNNIRQILKVNVPGKGSGGGGSVPSASSIANASAPVVSAADAGQTGGGVIDVRVTNAEDQVIKAYISDKDLQDNQQKTNFVNSLNDI